MTVKPQHDNFNKSREYKSEDLCMWIISDQLIWYIGSSTEDSCYWVHGGNY